MFCSIFRPLSPSPLPFVMQANAAFAESLVDSIPFLVRLCDLDNGDRKSEVFFFSFSFFSYLFPPYLCS